MTDRSMASAAARTRVRALGSVLALSAITHVSQLAVYGTASDTVASAAFGVAYGLIAVGIFRLARGALAAAVVLPVIGGLLGIYRLAAVRPNPFSVFHPILDVIIVSIAVVLWRETRPLGHAES